MLLPEIQAVIDDEAALAATAAAATSGDPAHELAQARAAYDAVGERWGGSGPAMARELQRTIPGPAGAIALHVYVPVRTGDEPPGVVVYLHGGGWTVGSPRGFHPVCRRVAQHAGAVVVSVDYRLAPEHPFPAPLEDALAALRWVAEYAPRLGADPRRLAVMGDSAGGNLAAAAVRRLAAEGRAPRLQVLVYPALDAAMDTPSYARCATGFRLTAAEMAACWAAYRAGADPADADVSPLRAAAFGDLPPALLLLAEHDPLRDEGEAYAARLREAGVAAELRVYPGTVHGLLRWPARVPAAEQLLADAGDALRLALA